MPRRNPNAAPADVVSLAEVGRRLDMHEQTVKRGVRGGRLPGVVIGNKYVIPRPWFERFMVGEWTPQPQQENAA